MIKTFFVLLALVTFSSGTASASVCIKNTAGSDTIYRIITAAGNTYGYDILVNSKLLIHQPSIPGIAGSKGFATKAAAEKAARLVIKKLQQGIMPPTITIAELDSLKIKY